MWRKQAPTCVSSISQTSISNFLFKLLVKLASKNRSVYLVLLILVAEM